MLKKMNLRNKKGIALMAISMTISTLAFFTGVLITAYNAETSNGVYETANTSNKNLDISSAKEEVQLLVADYAEKYYEAQYTDSGKKSKLDMADYIAKEIGGEVTKNDFEITTSDRDVTVSKDDITFEGTINDKGMVEWKENNKYENNEDIDDYLKKQEISAFNSMFWAYEGKQKGTQVKNLISTIQKLNKDNEDRKIEIKYMDKEYKESEFKDLKELIDDNEKYEVSCEENSDGIIDLIEIERYE